MLGNALLNYWVISNFPINGAVYLLLFLEAIRFTASFFRIPQQKGNTIGVSLVDKKVIFYIYRFEGLSILTFILKNRKSANCFINWHLHKNVTLLAELNYSMSK